MAAAEIYDGPAGYIYGAVNGVDVAYYDTHTGQGYLHGEPVGYDLTSWKAAVHEAAAKAAD